MNETCNTVKPKKKTVVFIITNSNSSADRMVLQPEDELEPIYFTDKLNICNYTDFIKDIKPDVIIFEPSRDQENSFSILKYLDENFQNIPVIILVDEENNDDRERYLKLDALDYLYRKDINNLGIVIRYILRLKNNELELLKAKEIIEHQKALLTKFNIGDTDISCNDKQHFPNLAGVVFDQFLFKILIDNLPDAIYFKDRQSKFIKVNNGFIKKINSFSENEIIGKSDFDIFDLEHARDARKDELYIIKTGRSIENKEEKEILSSGKILWVSTTKLPLKNTNGDIIGTFGMSRDITESKKYQVLLKQSEERLRYLISSTSAVLYNMRINGTSVDPVWVGDNITLFGYNQEEVLSPGWWIKVIHPDDSDYVNSIKKALFTSGKQLFEYRILHKEGNYIWVRDEMVLLRDSSGNPIEIFGSLLDISDRMKVEETVKANEYFLRKSQSVAQIGSYKYDIISGKWESSETLDEILGIDSSYNKNVKGWTKTIHPSHLKFVIDFIKNEVIAKRKRFEKEFMIIKQDSKQSRWVQAIGELELDVNGNPITLIGILQDITERVQRDNEKQELEKQLRNRNEELEIMISDLKRLQGSLIQTEKMASLGQLSAGIAHEINNPLAYVSSNINRIKEYFQDTVELLNKLQKLKIKANAKDLTEIDEFTKQIDLEFILNDFDKMILGVKDGIERIKKIIEGIRGFTYLSNSPHSEADINKAIEDTITIVWNEIKYKASIEKEYSEIPLVICNIGEIKQVIVNLLVNASHAIEEKGTIKITTSRDKKYILIKVHDTGCGISKENIKKIFDPFYTTKPIGKGTGLGLWICSSIIEKHAGSITVESEVGRGSTFIIRLPLE